MKRLLSILLFAALPLVSINAKDGTREGVVVMSFNMRNANENDGTNSWQYRYTTSAIMIDEQRPDVIGLQEADYEEQYMYLKTAMDKLYKFVGVGRDDGKKAGEVTAIAYNPKTMSLVKSGTFWLSEDPSKPGKGWDASCNRTATWAILKDKDNGGQFLFVNTHLDEAAEAQKNGIRLILDKIAEIGGNMPVVFAGDFNLEPGDAALEPVKAFASSARETAVVTDDHYSYNGWGKEKKTLDHIWYKGFSCTKFETVTKPYSKRTFISDHFPIKATLVF